MKAFEAPDCHLKSNPDSIATLVNYSRTYHPADIDCVDLGLKQQHSLSLSNNNGIVLTRFRVQRLFPKRTFLSVNHSRSGESG